MRKQIIKIQDWADERLRRLCGRITPEKRLLVVLGIFVVFSLISFYIFVSAIYAIGKNEGQKMEIEHIRQLQLQTPQENMNQLRFYDNGTDK